MQKLFDLYIDKNVFIYYLYTDKCLGSYFYSLRWIQGFYNIFIFNLLSICRTNLQRKIKQNRANAIMCLHILHIYQYYNDTGNLKYRYYISRDTSKDFRKNFTTLYKTYFTESFVNKILKSFHTFSNVYRFYMIK